MSTVVRAAFDTLCRLARAAHGSQHEADDDRECDAAIAVLEPIVAAQEAAARKDGKVATDPTRVTIHYFKPSGKWYCDDENVEWPRDPEHYSGWQPIAQLARLKDMIAVCLESPLGFPQMALPLTHLNETERVLVLGLLRGDVESVRVALRAIVEGDRCWICSGSRGSHVLTCPLSGVVPKSVVGPRLGADEHAVLGTRKIVPLTEQEKQRMLLEASVEGAQAHAKQVVEQLELAWFGIPRCTFVQDGKRCLFTEGHARAGFDDGHLLGTPKTETPKAVGCAMHHPRYVPGCYGCDNAAPDNGMLGPVNVRLANLENRVEQLERCQTKHASDIDRLSSKGTT